MQEAGSGITYALSGAAVTTTGPIVGFQEGVIDMSGPMTDYTIYSSLNHLVMIIDKQDHIDQHEHEEVVRLAGIKVANYVGKIGFDCKDYVSEHYEWKSIGEKYAEYPDLPKVVYVYNCMAQGLLHDTYFYGRDSKVMVPSTIFSPVAVTSTTSKSVDFWNISALSSFTSCPSSLKNLIVLPSAIIFL